MPAASRTAPLAIGFPIHAKYTTEIALPFPFTDRSEDVRVESAALDFRFTVVRRKSGTSYEYELASREPSLAPEDFAEHRVAVARARQTLLRDVIYSPPLANGPNVAVIASFAACLLLFGWCAYRLYRGASRPRPADAVAPSLRAPRMGGWLRLLALNVVVMPLVGLQSFVEDGKVAFESAKWAALTTPGLESYRPGLAVFLVVEMLGQLWLAAHATVVAVLFFRKSHGFPRQGIAVIAFVMALVTADVLVAVALGVEGSTLARVFVVVRSLVFGSAWIAYIRRSKRVAYTFVL